MNDADFDALALAVDERVLALAPGLDPARLFGVRLRPGGFVLVPCWSGVARELPAYARPPDGSTAIALETSGWAAPLDDCAAGVRPSEHPQRRRVHQTILVYGDDCDVAVLRYAAEAPQVVRGGRGAVFDRLVACWSRRREAGVA